MKIITFNIRCADDPDGHSIDERAPRLKEILAKYDPDIVGFQEATPKWLNYITEYYGENYEIFNKYRSSANSESVPIMWKKDKFDCIDKGYFWLTETPWIEYWGDEKYRYKRICMWVRFVEKATQKEFYYFNTHFGFGDPEQLLSVDLICKTAKLMNAERFAITGDFNMTPESKAYTAMTKQFSDVNMITERDMGTTFHGYGKEGVNEHIDYCFITPETITANGSKVIYDMVDGKYPSDHYGILFDLSL